MFPSEAYRELCIKNQEVLREKWEPKFGDWVINGDGELGIVRNVGAYSSVLISREGHMGGKRYEKKLCIPLFQPHQLIEMLEERGYWWRVSRPAPIKPKYSVVRWATEDPDEIGKIVTGLDPATALLKAYLEVTEND